MFFFPSFFDKLLLRSTPEEQKAFVPLDSLIRDREKFVREEKKLPVEKRIELREEMMEVKCGPLLNVGVLSYSPPPK